MQLLRDVLAGLPHGWRNCIFCHISLIAHTKIEWLPHQEMNWSYDEVMLFFLCKMVTYFLVLYYFPLLFMNIEKRFQRLMEQNISINKQMYLNHNTLQKNLFFLHPENKFSPTYLKTATRKGTILQFLMELFLYQCELM